MLTRDMIKSVAQVLDSKNVRFYCRVALVDYDKSIFVVSDGRMLVEIATPEIKKTAAAAGLTGRSCFSAAVLKNIARAMRARDTFDCTRAAVERAGAAELHAHDVHDYAKSYPDYRRVIPSDAKPDESGVFGLYAARYLKILEDIEHSSSFMHKSYHLPTLRTGVLKIVFDCYDSMTITAVVMPMNVEHDIRNKGAAK